MAFQKGNTFVFGETPSASKWDQLWRNDDALADGSGFDPGAIGTDTLAQSAFDVIGSYSTSEVATPFTWIDGKTIYKKTIDLGNGPNNTNKDVPLGISDIDSIVSYYGKSGDFTFPVSSAVNTSSIETIRISKADGIRWRSTYDARGNQGYVTLYYTKTS